MTERSEGLTIRRARPGEAGLVLGFIRELAEYERLLHEVRANEAELDAALFFAIAPAFFCDIAFLDGEPVGFALYFYNFSDLFSGATASGSRICTSARACAGAAIGKALLAGSWRGVASTEGHRATGMVGARLERTRRSATYRALGAKAMEEWTVQRAHGEVA